MSNKIKSVHEVYFLVRVGQMSEEDLNQWLQDNIDAAHADVDAIYSEEWQEADNWDDGDD
jgi:ferredoxin-fold anticodon binding domain-containing protein